MNDDDKELESLLSADSRRIILPARVFKVSRTVRIARSKCDIFGYGTTIEAAKDFPDSQPLVEVSGEDTSNRRNRVRLVGLDIEGGNRSVIGLRSFMTFRFMMRDCNINGVNGSGVIVSEANDFVAESCDIRNCGHMESDIPSVMLNGTAPPVPGLPSNHTSMNTVTMRSCIVERYRGVGIRAENQTILRIDGCKIHGTEEPRGVSVGGIQITGSNRVQLSGNHQVLGRDFDVEVVRSKEVKISGQIASLGRKPKIKAIASDVQVIP